DALLSLDSKRMLEQVRELEMTGQNLVHFCRELTRFFRNLLVARIAGSDSRLIAASGSERERLGTWAGKFSEEELTRALHLMLALFQDLQSSLQPRMHLELGLIRLVHAGRLRPIEEILAGLGNAPAAATPSNPIPPKVPASPARSAAPAQVGAE